MTPGMAKKRNGVAPAVFYGNDTAQNHAGCRAQRDGDMKNTHRPAALFFGIGRADHGRAARDKARFAQADKEAGNQNPSKVFSQSRGKRCNAPENGHETDGFPAAPAINQVSDRKGKKGHAEDQHGGSQSALGVCQIPDQSSSVEE